MAPRRTMVTGCNGQLGHAIRDYVEEHGLEASSSTTSTRSTSPTRPSTTGSTGACTARSSRRSVHRGRQAETPEGRPVAWKANAQARPCSPGRPRAQHHPGARELGLRVRRHRRGA